MLTLHFAKLSKLGTSLQINQSKLPIYLWTEARRKELFAVAKDEYLESVLIQLS